MNPICYFCGTERTEQFPDTCNSCGRFAGETPPSEVLASRVNCPMRMLEWDGSVSFGVLTSADAEKDLAIVTFDDGQVQRMGLTYLARLVV